MAIPTASNVMDLARSHLGDEAVAGGEIFTNTILLPFVNSATRELFRVMQNIQLPRVKVQVYFNLPANTSILYPSTANIADMGEPEWVEERDISGTYAVSGCTLSSGVPTLTTATHPLVTGQRVVTYGIGGITGAAGTWAITSSGVTSATLNGAVASGTYTSGGTMSYSTDAFASLEWADSISEAEDSGGTSLDRVAWIGDAFRFPSASTARQLRITYWSSAASLTSPSDSIGVDDSLDFLATRAAALAAASRGAESIAQRLNAQALGPKVTEADASGGLLRQLLSAAVLREQAEPGNRRQPFRRRRAAYPWF
jgi:hypothetical protein